MARKLTWGAAFAIAVGVATALVVALSQSGAGL
jgi:hypothetical protein